MCFQVCCGSLFLFFFKQKTAYEMRISDWSSDVCSSDLDVDARVAVGEADHLPNVDAHVLGHHRQLVGKGDVDVAIAVFDQLDHFGGARRGGYAGAAHELAVKGTSAARAARGNAADTAAVVGGVGSRKRDESGKRG